MRHALAFVAIWLSTTLGAAVAASPFDAIVVAEYRQPIVRVLWIETDDIRTICRPTSLACALPAGQDCIIYTYPDPAFDILGHEITHCFKGHFHPDKETRHD